MAGYYCPEVSSCSNFPNWLFFVVALNLFIYQTMDNIDGKQARRTGSSSPLGELFDHGCDSLFLTLMGMPWFIAMGVDNWHALMFLTQGTLAFYVFHWEEFHTHKLVMGLVSNPTEVQTLVMLVFIISGFYGPSFWTSPFSNFLSVDFVNFLTSHSFYGWPASLLPLPLYSVLSTFIWIIFSLTLTLNVVTTFRASSNFFAPFRSFAPFAILLLSLFSWAIWSPYHVLDNQTWMFLVMHGLIFSYLCVCFCNLPKFSNFLGSNFVG